MALSKTSILIREVAMLVVITSFMMAPNFLPDAEGWSNTDRSHQRVGTLHVDGILQQVSPGPAWKIYFKFSSTTWVKHCFKSAMFAYILKNPEELIC